MFYTRAVDISTYLKRDFKPLGDRVRDMTAILRHTHATLQAGRDNLGPILPKPFVESAIKQALGMQHFLEKDVVLEVARCRIRRCKKL